MIANELRRRIVRGDVPVGEALPGEEQLLTELAIARPTLRGAMRILESEQLVEIRRGRRGGTWVKAPTPDVLARRVDAYLHFHSATLDEVYAARALFEPPAVAIVAESAAKDDFDALAASLAAEEALLSTDAEQFSLRENEFHELMVNLAGNQTLIVLASMLQSILERDTQACIMRTDEAQLRATAVESHSSHTRVLELIRVGAVREAESTWREHLEALHGVSKRHSSATTVAELLS